jgi:hypothetical protein
MVKLGPIPGVTIAYLPITVGPGGGFTEVWYVGDLNGIISVPAAGLGHGLSGQALFTAAGGAVPDGGTTAMVSRSLTEIVKIPDGDTFAHRTTAKPAIVKLDARNRYSEP